MPRCRTRRSERRRLRAARLAAVEQRDAHRLGLVGEVVGDAGTREYDDADRQRFQELVVALERCRFLVACPVRLEHDWETLRASAQQAAIFSAPRGVPPWRSTISACLAITLSRTAQMRW